MDELPTCEVSEFYCMPAKIGTLQFSARDRDDCRDPWPITHWRVMRHA